MCKTLNISIKNEKYSDFPSIFVAIILKKHLFLIVGNVRRNVFHNLLLYFSSVCFDDFGVAFKSVAYGHATRHFHGF